MASPIGKHTSFASSNKIGMIGIMKKPKKTEERITRGNISVYKRKIMRTVATILPSMQKPESFLYALVFFKILIITMLPNMPEATHVALRVLVCQD